MEKMIENEDEAQHQDVNTSSSQTASRTSTGQASLPSSDAQEKGALINNSKARSSFAWEEER